MSATERVASAKAEMNVLREREAEFAMAQVESKAEVLEARGREATVKEANRERDFQLQQLKRRLDDLNKRLEARVAEQESQKLALQESELRCHRLRRELFESERDRKRVLDVVRKVMDRFETGNKAAQDFAASMGSVGKMSGYQTSSSSTRALGNSTRSPSPQRRR
eukprot:TRINITY_DN73746_c0_g1_i1.p2 TRINITY_DN73746_c0_g1~~TRINITY_DN73746_c0_g1_i1.p2  ORF type:complete len:166 (+),score=54.25 TRINITY_DN73746_c0_g1_i1:374-871(+)